MKSAFIKSCCLVLVASIFCSTLFLTSCGTKNNEGSSTTTENTLETPDVNSGNTTTPDTPSADNGTTNPNEKPVVQLKAGLYAHDTDTLLYTWDYLIKQKLITVKNSAISDVSNKLNGRLRISEEIIGISKSAFADCTSISGVYLSSSISFIGSSAFSGCSGLKTLEMGDCITKIGSSAFKNCTGLETVIIGNKVTSIEASAFQNCTNLRYLVISDSVTFIGKSAFSGCTGLKTAYIGKNITYVGDSAFSGCTALEKVIFSSGVSYIGTKCFYNCNRLTDIMYKGTEADFGFITIGTNNTTLDKKKVKFSIDANAEKVALEELISKYLSTETDSSES